MRIATLLSSGATFTTDVAVELTVVSLGGFTTTFWFLCLLLLATVVRQQVKG